MTAGKLVPEMKQLREEGLSFLRQYSATRR